MKKKRKDPNPSKSNFMQNKVNNAKLTFKEPAIISTGNHQLLLESKQRKQKRKKARTKKQSSIENDETNRTNLKIISLNNNNILTSVSFNKKNKGRWKLSIPSQTRKPKT